MNQSQARHYGTASLIVRRAARHERVGLVRLHRGKGVVHVAVASLIRADSKDEVAHLGIVSEHPILLADLGSVHVLPRRQTVVVNVLDAACVRLAGLLLEVAHEAVGSGGRGDVDEEVEVPEDSLGAEHGGAEDEAGLLHGQEGEQVHPLVLCLLQQGVDPAMVATQGAQRAEVAPHGPDHAWHASHGLEEQEAPQILVLVHGRAVAGEEVEPDAEELHESEGSLVGHRLGLVVRDLHVQLLLGVHGMHQQIVDILLVLHLLHVALATGHFAGVHLHRG
mmetsp:Transcript_13356/g.42591  ORF Transcript_13356/g.42591 Transcript_13356/m.42591 type:complete len:279 (-) Transcript_13356:188-1024(-)